eukprot:g72.t3
MYRAGYRQITSIDNSATVIQQMQEAHGEDGLEWFCMDVGEMSLAEQSFDVVIEKGLLDCLACMEDAHLATAKCMKEVIRILKFDGFFFCISFNHQRAPSLTSAPYHFRLCELQRTAALGAEYYVYVFQKASASILSLWPSYWRDLRLRLSEEDYRLIDQEGTWTDALDAQVGDVLEVVEDFDSGDQEAVRLTRGLRGILHFRDRDGDAMVRFPRLDAESVDRFVFEEDVRCSMRKRDLDLAQNQLSGEIPKELGQPQSLKYMILHQNRLNGKIPTELGQLQSLQRLQLAQNQLSGEIPKELSQLQSLQYLHLAQNNLSGEIPKELGQLPLTELHLDQNYLSGAIPKELGQLQYLTDLHLDQNQLSGQIPKEVGQFLSLQMLSLARNQLSGEIPKELSELPSLEVESKIATPGVAWCGCRVLPTRSTKGWILFLRDERRKRRGLGDSGEAVVRRPRTVPRRCGRRCGALRQRRGRMWNSHTQLLGGMYILFFGMVVFSWPLGQKFLQTYRSLCIGQAARVAASNVAVLKAAGGAFALACPLLMFFWQNARYYAAAPPLWNATASNFETDPGVDSELSLFEAQELQRRCATAGVATPLLELFDEVLAQGGDDGDFNLEIEADNRAEVAACAGDYFALFRHFALAEGLYERNTWGHARCLAEVLPSRPEEEQERPVSRALGRLPFGVDLHQVPVDAWAERQLCQALFLLENLSSSSAENSLQRAFERANQTPLNFLEFLEPFIDVAAAPVEALATVCVQPKDDGFRPERCFLMTEVSWEDAKHSRGVRALLMRSQAFCHRHGESLIGHWRHCCHQELQTLQCLDGPSGSPLLAAASALASHCHFVGYCVPQGPPSADLSCKEAPGCDPPGDLYEVAKKNRELETAIRRLSRSGEVNEELEIIKAFAGYRMLSGPVVVWGDANHGGDSRWVQHPAENILQVYATDYAFAAVLTDGRVTAWGGREAGGNCGEQFVMMDLWSLGVMQNVAVTAGRCKINCERCSEFTQRLQLLLQSARMEKCQTVCADFYDATVYPPWHKGVECMGVLPVPIFEHLQRLCPGWAPSEAAMTRQGKRLLVAGCGSGHQVAVELKTYSDITDVAVAQRKLKELLPEHMARVRFLVGDIMDLTLSHPLLSDGFDLVVCCGVLHHLPKPLEGLQRLASVLRPSGVIQLATYSALSHQTWQNGVQDWLRSKNLKPESGIPTRQEVRAMRAEVLKPEERPEEALTLLPAYLGCSNSALSKEFYTYAGVLDLLFHPLERSFTLLQLLEELILPARLKPLGVFFLDVNADLAARRAFRARFGEADMSDLDQWHALEVSDPDLFGRMHGLFLTCDQGLPLEPPAKRRRDAERKQQRRRDFRD